ncbi:MAG: hypothetical protein QXP80_05705 [Zestosphaera sp.]
MMSMWLEALSLLGVVASNTLIVAVGFNIYTTALAVIATVATYNATLYGIYRGASPTLIPPALATTTLAYLALTVLALPGFIVDLVMLATLLTLAGFYWDYMGVKESFNYVTPLALLTGVLIGVWTGLATPLRFCLASMIDAISYRLLRERYPLKGLAVSVLLIAFAAIYLSPVVYVNVFFLGFNLLLYLGKALIHEMNVGDKVHVADLDVLLKPLVARWLA